MLGDYRVHALVNMNMDTITPEQCQTLIGSVNSWEAINITKSGGGDLRFKQAEVTVWGEHHANILHELILRYDVGDYCTLHVDSPWRKIHPSYVAYAVWITPLNAGYEGGDLYFDGELIPQQVGVPLKYKRNIPHEITPITSGTRYSLVSWVFIEDTWRKNNAELWNSKNNT